MDLKRLGGWDFDKNAGKYVALSDANQKKTSGMITNVIMASKNPSKNVKRPCDHGFQKPFKER